LPLIFLTLSGFVIFYFFKTGRLSLEKKPTNEDFIDDLNAIPLEITTHDVGNNNDVNNYGSMSNLNSTGD